MNLDPNELYIERSRNYFSVVGWLVIPAIPIWYFIIRSVCGHL